ncbi:asparagine-rich protein-like [Mytilus trossulus]|uniref:asparagine-rich protein-like n=1 Tax=Mytilus trossulus TaxID=6551 RepID=UPI003003AF86
MILCLTETKLDDVDEIDCDNFIFHYKNRKKLANHKSGGIALGFKKYLDKYIKYIQSDCQFVLWFSIDKKVLDLPKDAIFGIIYIPPINTSYTSEDAFTEIEFELQNFCSKTNYITMLGDFYSRTGNLSDFYNIDKDSSFENNFTDYNELSDVDVLDELGIPRLRNNVHSPLSLQLYTNNEIQDKLLTETLCCGDERVNKWKNEKYNEYKNNIDRNKVDDICNRLSAYINDVNNVTKYDMNNIVTKYDMNNIVTDICDTLTESAKTTFGTSTFNKTMFKCSKNQFSKDWYNKDCKKAQREFRKSQRLYKHYGSNIFKERLRQSELHYKKVMDVNIKNHNTEMSKKMKGLKTKNPKEFWKLFNRGTHPVFARSRQNSTVNIEDDDHYSEIRESMMVRPMTVNGRKLSIRSSYIDSDDSNDQYHRIELATSLQKPNLKNSTNEYTTLIVEPFLQPKNNNIYEQLLIDESTESQRNTDNAIQARVVKNHSNACSPQKDLNTTEYSDKFNSVTEGVYTEDNVDNCTERETTAYSMQMPLNLSYISDKTDFVTDIQISSDNTTYAKEVKNSANECSSKLHLNTSTGIPDNLNFVTNNNGEINEINIESKAYTEGNEGDMTTEIEFERKNRSDEFEENNSNTKVVLNKITNNMVTLL